MKLLFVQLSDMHCLKTDLNNTAKIEKAVTALSTLGKVDGAVLIFSGDLTDQAKKDEFGVGKQMIGKFLSALGGSLNCGRINTMIVPGNHDISLSDNNVRSAAEIVNWILDEHLADEIERLNAFYKYSISKSCFQDDKICDVHVITVCGLKIQICLLNSAPFSTKEPDDKQFHYIPQKYRSQISRLSDVDLKITVMHHHFEWCVWDTKEMIKKSISSDDVTFFGHDHKSEQIKSKYADGKEHRIIMGGKFSINLENDSEFNALIYDTNTNEFSSYTFDWNKEGELFTKHQNESFKKKSLTPVPSSGFLEKLLKDPQNVCENVMDYFVFPKLTAEGEVFESIGENKDITDQVVFDAIKSDRMIRVTGDEGSGKTTLLKSLYTKAIEQGYVPLLIENRDYRDSKIDKMLIALFEEQYQIDRRIASDFFEQIDKSKIIVFIDDADLIKSSKARDNLFNSILDKGYALVYTTKEKDQNLEEIVKNKLQGKEISTICIPPMFKESRDALIENVGRVLDKDEDLIEGIKTAFDYMVQNQTNLFTFTPANTLQYVKFFIQNTSNDKSATQTLSMVFETNIRNSLFQVSKKDAVATLYLSVLEFIADKMYFELKTESIDPATYSKIISDFKAKRRAELNEKQFLTVCTEAHLFVQKDDSLDMRFYDKNTYAYFVAKAINREFEKDSSKLDKIEYVMKHICFGINDTIILFLSFIRSNTNIVLTISEKANELLANYPEWDFDSNLPFLKADSNLSSFAPSKKEAKENTKAIENIEKQRHNAIQFRGIFDYSEADVVKQKYIILKAFKYVQLVSRALVDQYGNLEDAEIECILNTIFRIPQKVIYALLNPYQENSASLVKSIIEFAKERIPDETISELTVRKMLANTATVLALNIMNDIAFNSSNISTISVLKTGPEDSSNHRIMKLMMEENEGNTEAFINSAIELRKEFEKNQYARTLIAQIARKHIMYHQNVDYRAIDRLISGKVFSEKSKATLLLERGAKDDQ